MPLGCLRRGAGEVERVLVMRPRRNHLERALGGSVGGLQWVIDAYTLALASVMLTAGSLHQFPEPRARAGALGVWGGVGSLGVPIGPVLGAPWSPRPAGG